MIVTIIGFGVRGLHSLFTLVKGHKNSENLHVNIVTPYDFFITGTEYSNFSSAYLLHKTASEMDEGYYDWLVRFQASYRFTKDSFTPRYMYGQYLMYRFEEIQALMEKNNITYNVIHDSAESIVEINNPNTQGTDLIFVTSESSMVRTDKAIISPEQETRSVTEISSISYNLLYCGVFDVWSKQSFALHQNPSSVCHYYNQNYLKSPTMITIFGSSLSSIEFIYNLKSSNFVGKIYCISRTGRFNFPHRHRSTKAEGLITEKDVAMGMIFVVAKIKNFLRKNKKIDIVDIVDGIDIDALWENAPDSAKDQFMRHLYDKWDTVARTAPEEDCNIVMSGMKSGEIVLIKGGVYDVANIEGYNVAYYDDGNIRGAICSHVVINADHINKHFSGNPLIQNMCKQGMLKRSGPEYTSVDNRVMFAGGVFGGFGVS